MNRRSNEDGAALIICLILLTASTWVVTAQSKHSNTNIRLYSLLSKDEDARILADLAVSETSRQLIAEPALFLQSGGRPVAGETEAGNYRSIVSIIKGSLSCNPDTGAEEHFIEIRGYGATPFLNNRIVERTHVQGFSVCAERVQEADESNRILSSQSADRLHYRLRKTYWYPLVKDSN